MKYGLSVLLLGLGLGLNGGAALAQATVTVATEEQKTELDAVEVTGSRIKTTDIEGQAPVFTLDRKAIDRSGLGSLGDILQGLTSSGKGLNSKFNSSGNFGFPADGGGIGAGSTQIDLRHLEPKRALVLVDGIRWVNESSASGVGGVVDLNTIPLSIVERIEVLEDGASAIYGSDAIAGVINIITRKDYQGKNLNAYFGMYDEGDGETAHADFTWGGTTFGQSNTLISIGYFNQELISSADREQSRFPVPGTGVTRGSSGTPQGRFRFCDRRRTPDCLPENYLDLALNDRTAEPFYDSASPNMPPSTYHDFSNADRFNFAPFNLLLTPNERGSIFLSHNMELTDDVRLYAKALYNHRESLNRAAPEPIFVGPDAGTGGIADTVIVPANQPFNPFGQDLDSGNLSLIARRPLEGGPRLFMQEVDTYYVATGLQGLLDVADRAYSWDANFAYSDNQAEQSFQNGYNTQRIKNALGDPAACAAIPGCVPLNIFGGQGADGRGTITQEMLGYIRINTQDKSDNQLSLFSANITGDIVEMPAGMLAFASGYEFRKYEGSFTPDDARIARESQDSPAIPTAGSYNVNEVYTELSAPLLANQPLAHSLDVSAALRYSRYSTFGGQTTGKAGIKWRPVEDLVLRGTYAQGFRAPLIGELFGLAQFGASITDPCSNQVSNDDDGDGQPDANPSPDTPTEANCRALGVPNGYEQSNPQIITNTGGNPNLKPEKSDSYTAGFVYSPAWAENLAWVSRLDLEATYYSHEIEDAIRAPDAQSRLNDCVASGNANSEFCSGITRTPNGQINRFDNLLANNGNFETDGVDLKINYGAPDLSLGRVSAALQATYVQNYRVTDSLGSEFPQREGVEVNDGAIPRLTSNLQVDWAYNVWSASWVVRYIGKVTEACTDGLDGSPNSLTNLGLCSNPDTADNGNSTNELEATFYNDVQVGWEMPFGAEGVKLTAGINNLFGEDPPVCTSCSLNGYDAGTYDLPGQFGYVQADWKF